MFHLYAFTIADKIFFVSHKTWKDARNLIVREPEHKNVKLTDFVGRCVKRNACPVIGILDTETVYRNYPWWGCRCGSESFLPLNDGTSCRCTLCGREYGVHF